MKIKLNVVDLREADEHEGMGMTIEYDNYPTQECIFYTVDSIAPLNSKYSSVTMAGLEYVVKMPFSKLEKEIDKQKRLIINDN